jgi:hypothetical protein
MSITRKIIALSLASPAALHAAEVAKPAAETSAAPCNVQFIAIDDMNDWVGSFGGAPQAPSATRGSVVFQQANCDGRLQRRKG